MNFGYINGAGGGRTGVSIGEPGRAVKILDSATDSEKAKALRELAGMYDPEVKLFPRPLPKYVEVETTDFDRVRFSLHGKSVLLAGNPECDFDLLAEYIRPFVSTNPEPPASLWAAINEFFRNVDPGFSVVTLPHSPGRGKHFDVFANAPIPNSVLAERLRVLADTITPHPTHTLDAESGPEPSVRRPLAAAEWQCVASALGLAVAMLESNSPEVIRAAQALAVSKVHELRS